jgi:hypothetical protein
VDIIFFWIPMPIANNYYQILVGDWERYLQDRALVTLVVVLIAVLVVVGLYTYSARQRRIHSSVDLFRPYNCMWWLLLSIPAGVAAAIEAALTFPPSTPTQEAIEKTIQQTARWQEALGTSIGIGLETSLLCLVFAALLILIPGITPPAFKYRPQEWLFPWTQPKRS